jgi:SAM-dependent methyltransferase
VTSIFLFHELPPKVRRIAFRECVRVLKPGGCLVLVDSLQRGDQPDYQGLLELFPQNYHEPYYRSYTNEDFNALAASCGLKHIRDVKAIVSKVMVFDSRHAELRSCGRQEVNRLASDDFLRFRNCISECEGRSPNQNIQQRSDSPPVAVADLAFYLEISETRQPN